MHRDIKLDNILVKLKADAPKDIQELDRAISDFEFKIGDLGLAKTLQSEK
jgi:serine/threonine protein kinase